MTKLLLHRIVEVQATTVTHQLTDTAEEYEFIEGLIETTKPEAPSGPWHYLIRTPFRYPLPAGVDYAARFKPPFSSRHIFYGTCLLRTALYEFTYHWLKERVHLIGLSQTEELRSRFAVGFLDPTLTDLTVDPGIHLIMDRRNYTASHQWADAHPEATSILYPSCREPERGSCVAAFKLESFDLRPAESGLLFVSYSERARAAQIRDPAGIMPSERIHWKDVA